MRQDCIKKTPGIRKSMDDFISYHSASGRPSGLAGSCLIALAIVININLGPIIPEPKIIPSKTKVIGNFIIIIFGPLYEAVYKTLFCVAVMDDKMRASINMPFIRFR